MTPGQGTAGEWAGTFLALLARDLRVLRRQLGIMVVRTLANPLLFVFVFAYVFPKIGEGFRSDTAGTSFSTVIVPGLVAVSINFQGILAVTQPLIREFSVSNEIEDRVLAPIPVWLIGVEKIAAGATQAILAAGVVFPIVYFVHASNQAPTIHVHDWPLFTVVLVFSACLGSSLGLLVGTLFDPRASQLLFAVIVVPITFLGCVYYPWARLAPIRWLQVFVLINPLVYMSEALRTTMTPQLPHMPVWAILLALVGGSLALGTVSARLFSRRVLS